MRDELSDYEWVAIRPLLPNKPRSVRRVDDRRVLNGIFWVLRSGAPWRNLPESFGPYTTCYNRFVRWRRAGVWDQILDALTTAHDEAVEMIDTSIVRVHQHGASIAGNKEQLMGRSRGGLRRSSKLFLQQRKTCPGPRIPVQHRGRGTNISLWPKFRVSCFVCHGSRPAGCAVRLRWPSRFACATPPTPRPKRVDAYRHPLV